MTEHIEVEVRAEEVRYATVVITGIRIVTLTGVGQQVIDLPQITPCIFLPIRLTTVYVTYAANEITRYWGKEMLTLLGIHRLRVRHHTVEIITILMQCRLGGKERSGRELVLRIEVHVTGSCV